MFPNANLKEPRTARQRHIAELEQLAIEQLVNDDAVPVQVFDNKPDFSRFMKHRCVYLTHQVVDLLYVSVGYKELLESYTGKLKRRNEWSSKLKALKGDDVRRFPFDTMTIQLFGDKGTC